MRKSQLFKLLTLLKDEEWLILIKFIHSPYINNTFDVNKECIIDFIYMIKPFIEDSKKTGLNKQVLHQKLFPDKPYRVNKIDKLMSTTKKLIENFLKHQYLLKDKDNLFWSLFAIANTFKERGKPEKFYTTISKLSRELEKEVLRGEDYYYREFLLANEIFESDSFFNTRTSDLKFNSVILKLKQYTLTKKLDYLSIYLQQSKFRKSKPENLDDEFKTILSSVEDNMMDFLNLPILKIYKYLFKLIPVSKNYDPSLNSFEEYLSLFHQFESQIPLKRIQIFCSHARNFCTDQYNQGKSEYLARLFKLYDEHLNKGYLYTFIVRALPSSIYTNIVRTGLKLKELEWVGFFLKSNAHDNMIGIDNPQSVYKLNKALYLFEIRKFNEAWNIIIHENHTYKDPFNNLLIRILEIKLLFEKKEFRVLFDRLRTIRQFMKKKFSEQRQIINSNFTKTLWEMVKIYDHPGMRKDKLKTKFEVVERKINSERLLGEKEWLVEKLTELKVRYGL